jgi:hypothetical protein
MAIFGALLVCAGSVSVCAILQGCRHRYMEISSHTVGTVEMTLDETSTVPHRDPSPNRTEKGSVLTVQVDDDDDDGLL